MVIIRFISYLWGESSGPWGRLYTAGALGTFVFLMFFAKSSDYGTLHSDYGILFFNFRATINAMLAFIWPIYWTIIRGMAPAVVS